MNQVKNNVVYCVHYIIIVLASNLLPLSVILLIAQFYFCSQFFYLRSLVKTLLLKIVKTRSLKKKI